MESIIGLGSSSKIKESITLLTSILFETMLHRKPIMLNREINKKKNKYFLYTLTRVLFLLFDKKYV